VEMGKTLELRSVRCRDRSRRCDWEHGQRRLESFATVGPNSRGNFTAVAGAGRGDREALGMQFLYTKLRWLTPGESLPPSQPAVIILPCTCRKPGN
jgi:hypothetical protein